MRILLLPLLLFAIGTAIPTTAAAAATAATAATEFLSLEEALELAFPDCAFERSAVLLTVEQKKSAEKLSGVEIDSRMTIAFIATHGEGDDAGKLAGWAYVDTHRVRTKRETILILLTPDDRIRRIEILAFAEPQQYLPRPKWYAQFVGKKLDKQLRLKGDIRPVAGATLTASVTTDAVRRMLAVHRIAGPPQKKSK